MAANPNDKLAPRFISTGTWNAGYIAAPYAQNSLMVSAVVVSVVSLIMFSAPAPWIFSLGGLCLGLILGIAALVVKSKAKKHPLAAIDSPQGLLVYNQWYDLPLDLRAKIHIDPELLNRVAKVEKMGVVKEEIKKLHELDEQRKLAEARLDTSADELLESVRQAQRDEESYLSEIKALESKENNERH